MINNLIKPILLLLIALTFIFSSCKKQMVTCTYNIYYLDAEIAIENYNVTVLDSIYHIIYEKGTQVLQSSGKVLIEDFSEEKDVFFLKTADTLGKIGASFDHLIVVGTDTFHVENITLGPTHHTFEMEDHCSPGAGQARFYPFESYIINGQVAQPYSIGLPRSYIILKKP